MAEEKKSNVKLSSDAKKIAEMLEKMTVLEVSELVKALEDKFGVSAAAPAAVAAAPVQGAESEEKEEKTEFNVELAEIGSNKIAVIRIVKNATGVGLKEAKDLVEAAPKVIKEALNKADAEALQKELVDAGAKVNLK